MRLVYAKMDDHTRHMLFAAPADFDPEKWLTEERRQVMRLLGIVRIEVEER